MATISDDFNRADADALGSSAEGWSWTEVLDDLDILGNECVGGSGIGWQRGRAESDLDGDAHYAQVTVTDHGAGNNGACPCIRYSPSADTAYMAFYRNSATDTARIFKIVAGVLTQVGSSLSETPSSVPFDVYLEQTAGDDLTMKVNGATKVTVNDTSITGNTRTGVSITGTSTLDDFVAGDLGGGGNPFDHRPLTLMGVGA